MSVGNIEPTIKMDERLVTEPQKKLNTNTNKTKKKKDCISKTKRKLRTAKRKLRKKQSKLKYYQSLQKIRYHRSTQDLCSAVEFVEINDMDWTPIKCSTALPTEITDWHKQDQIAYWKSRAISLELENRMLKQHLRNVYAQTIVDNNEQSIEEPPLKEYKHDKMKKNKPKEKEKEIIPNFPNLELNNRMEEMRKLYGNMAEKLISTETAMQLNYEQVLEEFKPVFWPTLPLKL